MRIDGVFSDPPLWLTELTRSTVDTMAGTSTFSVMPRDQFAGWNPGNISKKMR